LIREPKKRLIKRRNQKTEHEDSSNNKHQIQMKYLKPLSSPKKNNNLKKTKTQTTIKKLIRQ